MNNELLDIIKKEERGLLIISFISYVKRHTSAVLNLSVARDDALR